MTSRIIVGDALESLRGLESDSVQCCMTSPPYWGLRDYGEPGQLGLESTPEEHVTAMTAVFKQVRRVLRPDGTLWLNYGDCYAANGERGNHNGEGSSTMGWPGQRAETLNKVAGMKLPKTEHGLKPKDLVGMPWRIAFALQAAGWWLRSDIIWHKPNPMPESVTDRPTKSHEYVFLLTKQARYFYDADAVREGNSPGSVERFGIVEGLGNTRRWRTSANKRDGKADGTKSSEDFRDNIPAGRNLRSVWTIPTQPFPEAHFATYPEELAARCILAGTSEYGACAACGTPWERVTEKEAMVVRRTHNHPDYLRTRTSGTMVSPPRSHTTGWEPACACGTEERRPCVVLDPFCGSGTTGLVAARYGRSFVGIELNPGYADMARRRIAPALAQPQLIEI